MEAAAGNNWSGKEVMTLLLDRWGDQITITEEVVEAAAGNEGNGKEVMTLLLDRRGDQITITEGVVEAAVGNEQSGESVLALLLNCLAMQSPLASDSLATTRSEIVRSALF